MKPFYAFVKKEFIHVFRDTKNLLLLFGLPIVQIILFGFALTNEIKNINIAVCDYANDMGSRRIIEKFKANDIFKLHTSLTSHLEIEDVFQQGETQMILVFPPHFYSDLVYHKKANIQLIADASDPNMATALTGYASKIIYDFQQTLNETNPPPLQIGIETRMIYNPELKGATNFVPGVMALVLLLICVLMTSSSIVKEKESGTMEVLLVSPLNPLMVILAKAIPYLILSIINLIIIVLLSIFLLDMPLRGNLFLLFGESILFIITSLSIGLVISNSTNTQQEAMLISLMGMLLPTLIFTGFMFPLENMPKLLQWLAHIVPSKWYYIIVKSIMIKGLSFTAIWKETVILAVMTLILLVISIKKFKNRLA